MQRRIVTGQTRAGHQAGVERFDRHAACPVVEAAIQFVGEEQVAELGGGVPAPAIG